VSSSELPELRSAELLTALLARNVQFLVVGGIGAQLRGATLATKDLDVCVPWTLENFERLETALDDLQARLDLPPERGDLEIRASAEPVQRRARLRGHGPRARSGIATRIATLYPSSTPSGTCRANPEACGSSVDASRRPTEPAELGLEFGPELPNSEAILANSGDLRRPEIRAKPCR
jgi:hypothetical protein